MGYLVPPPPPESSTVTRPLSCRQCGAPMESTSRCDYCGTRYVAETATADIASAIWDVPLAPRATRIRL